MVCIIIDLKLFQKKLSVLNKLLELDPGHKNAEKYRKEVSLCHWKVAEYDLSFSKLPKCFILVT